MFKGFILVVFTLFSTSSLANVDIDLACKEKKEQQRSLLEKLSTSVTEAHLAGQCTGYYSYNMEGIEWKESCSEFLEQKESLLSSLSTSLKEAHLSGRCVGAIYRVAKQCGVETNRIDYAYIARGALTVHKVEQLLGCYGEQYGW
ncbi:hypothetical protein CWC11_10840 [Pseudoalteromonas sp. S3178]|uniref:hypothetical protein n=1 Tax=Pseudoalteromonas sp. S3178 TaxID=579532 RepID=UPI00110B907A|nr:hypothetical protein [Pseudoalteromonas sp. S3178]TMP04863.1 hypothetical protein CWC11_10840 [Pseudoalteromonas sp. S3178]